MTDDTLAAALAGLRPVGPPSPELRSRRQALADFIRVIEPRVHSATGVAREQVRAALGWDEGQLAALGGRRSLPVYAAVYGASLRDRLDDMLSQPLGGLADIVTRSLQEGTERKGSPPGAGSEALPGGDPLRGLRARCLPGGGLRDGHRPVPPVNQLPVPSWHDHRTCRRRH